METKQEPAPVEAESVQVHACWKCGAQATRRDPGTWRPECGGCDGDGLTGATWRGDHEEEC